MIVFFGMGKTGCDLAQYYLNFESKSNSNEKLVFWDSRPNPPFLATIQSAVESRGFSFQLLDEKQDSEYLRQASTIYLSPALEPKKIIDRFKDDRIISKIATKIQTDLDVFSHFMAQLKTRQKSIPQIIGITGTNGKSTICKFIHELCQKAGLRSEIIGNYGDGFLNTLARHQAGDGQNPTEVYILEISSFQLDYSKPVALDLAAIANIYPEHLDWHGDFSAYQRAKFKIFSNARHGYHFESLDFPESVKSKFHSTSLNPVGDGIFQELNAISAFRNVDSVNQSNFAISYALFKQLLLNLKINQADLPLSLFERALLEYETLPYRKQRVGSVNQVEWFNDSKSTNTHSLMAALSAFSLNDQSNLWLILGGNEADLKGLDFKDVAQMIANHPGLEEKIKMIAIYGGAKEKIQSDLLSVLSEMNQENQSQNRMRLVCFSDLTEATKAIHAASQNAQKSGGHHQVLFSPGCASLSQYKNYAHRGEVFNQLVATLR